MKVRALCALLTVLLLVAPLGASLCGDCVAGHCMATDLPETPVTAEPRVASHCHDAADAVIEDVVLHAVEEAPAPCHDAAPTLVQEDCCAIAAAPEPESAIAPPASVGFALTLSTGVDAEVPGIAPNHSAPRRSPPIPLHSEPLYTLHSAFLI